MFSFKKLSSSEKANKDKKITVLIIVEGLNSSKLFSLVFLKDLHGTFPKKYEYILITCQQK